MLAFVEKFSLEPQGQKEFSSKVKYFDGAEDGEAGEEPHGASDQRQSRLCCHLLILLYLVISLSAQVNIDILYRLVGDVSF